MDALHCILGSELRADVLAALFVGEPRPWRLSELASATNRPPQNISRELDWLAGMGIVSVSIMDKKRSYAVDTRDPLTRQLGQFVRQARGPVPAMREALLRLTLPVIAWLVRAGPTTTVQQPTVSPSELIVLTSVPRSVIQLQLAKVIGREVRIYPMSVAEWMARLQKGEIVARRARRARKLWVVGSWSDLVRAESHHLEFRRTLDAATADWREELSDEWDEDYDPLDSKERTG